MSNLNKLFQHAQQMQGEMKTIQDELSKEKFEGNAGGGMVKAIVNGQMKPVDLTIEKEIINKEEKEMLEDLIVAAFTAAQEKAQKTMKEKMKSITGLPNLGGLF